MNHRVHVSEAVHLTCERARLADVGEVADDAVGAAVEEVAQGLEPVAAASVDDDVVSLLEQRLRGHSAETIGGAGDEDARHAALRGLTIEQMSDGGGERLPGERLRDEQRRRVVETRHPDARQLLCVREGVPRQGVTVI